MDLACLEYDTEPLGDDELLLNTNHTVIADTTEKKTRNIIAGYFAYVCVNREESSLLGSVTPIFIICLTISLTQI